MNDETPSDRVPHRSSKQQSEPLEARFQLDFIWPSQNAQLAPCGASCPAGGSIREWIGLVAQRSKLGLTKKEAYRLAWELIVDRNPFPATMGRICPHPCESGCNRIEKDDAVAVNQMERFLGDWAIAQGLALPGISRTKRNETVCVIGAGPAGLSFAYQMARRGYAVTIYDRHEKAGGMLRYGVPDYRLPPEILDREIQRIVDFGVTIEHGMDVGENPTLETLTNTYEVIFVGIGAQSGKTLDIPGENGPGVFAGTEYLHRINSGEEVKLGDRVIVVGGGNTAIDAARSARRRGAAVTVLYRRSREEMPANDEEVSDAMEEGVAFEFLTSPAEIRRNADKVVSVLVQRMRLGELDQSGRRRPIPIVNSTFELPAQAVISAVSQEVEWSSLNTLRQDGGLVIHAGDPFYGPFVYSGGDVGGLGIASLAIGQGRAAAAKAHAQLREAMDGQTSSAEITHSPKLPLYDKRPRVEIDRLPASARLKFIDAEVSATISEEEFLSEAERCLSCGSCFGCRHCWMYCNAGAFIEVDEQSPGNYYMMDLSICEGCGKCIEVCPTGFLMPGPPPRT